ncbi:hypothetical protein LSH36_138g07005 [Paralvinella palmiformis]|uniref:CBM21 domain-containing protein n=1 Tax=Paralvinella palmiformis TaxID=53620 RepID=A0AAD9JXW8_9ANNE|nr:hypothetical protein LSH36_138g07005 [Paralvinella palmiformis]
MALDFDRYLFASDPGIDSLVIQKAYKEWSSYCYAGFGVRSAGGQPSSTESHSRWPPHLGDNSLKTAHITISTRIGGLVRAQHRRECVERDRVADDRSVLGHIGQDRSRMGDNTSITPPIKCQQADRKCIDISLSTQRGPALGLSGLRCQGAKNGLPVSRRLATETFPKCATWRPRTTPTLGRNGVSRIADVNSHLVVPKPTAIVTSSRSPLTAIDDVIEECSSAEEDSASEAEPPREVASSRRRKVAFADERGEPLVRCRVFERDQSPIVFCNITLESTSSDGDTTEDDDKESESDTASPGGEIKFTILADDTYRHLNRDIDKLKKLIDKHRRYFDSLRPNNDVTNGARCDDSKVGGSTGDETFSDSVDNLGTPIGSPEVTPRNDRRSSSILSTTAGAHDVGGYRFINFDLENFDDVGSGNTVTLRRLRVDRRDRFVAGDVRIRDPEENPTVFIRYTTDDWRTQCDVSGCRSPNTDETRSPGDLFRFRIPLDASHVTVNPVKLEFAICCRTVNGRAEFWDNNGGRNYVLDVSL